MAFHSLKAVSLGWSTAERNKEASGHWTLPCCRDRDGAMHTCSKIALCNSIHRLWSELCPSQIPVSKPLIPSKTHLVISFKKIIKVKLRSEDEGP